MEWKLKDLTVDEKGSYGIGAPAVPYQENKLTYLRITDINDDGSLNFSDLKSVDAEDAEKYILKENDIVFARTGNSTGRSYFYEKQHGPFVYAGFLIKFSLDPNKVNPRIMKYYTHSKPYFDWVNSFDTGATRGNINAKTYGDMEIELPSRKVQDKIVSILSSLDRKIELNNKINADLEEMAQTIFKNWFVDFEPFKDGKFVDSELGMIPEGWKVGTLDEIFSLKYGKNLSTSMILEKGDYPVYGANGIIGYYNEYNCDKYSVLVTSRGNGSGDVSRTHHPQSFITNNSFVVEPLEHYKYIKLPFINGLFNIIDFKSYCSGSAQPQLTNKAMRNICIISPPMKLVIKYCEILETLFSHIECVIDENSRLSLLRDTLLPRLMSGELEVPE